MVGGATTLGNTAPSSHHSQSSLLSTPRDRPSLHPLILALMEMYNWLPTHKTSFGGAPVKENGCPTGEDMWAFSNPLVTVTYTNREYPQNHQQTHKYSALLSFPLVHTLPSLRLTLALGTTEELPGCSCKVIKEALTAHWFRPPQSGLYWVTLEEGCGSGHQKRAVKVGQLTLVQLVRQHAGTRWRGGSGERAAKIIFT